MADDISSPGDKADCGHPNPIWFADNELWNAVMGGKAAKDDPGGVLCPTCFMLKAGEVLRVSRPAPKADSALVRELAYHAETLQKVKDVLANGAHFADDPECHPLYPNYVVAVGAVLAALFRIAVLGRAGDSLGVRLRRG